MNILAIASFGLAAAVFGWAAYTSTDTPSIFVNLHGVVIIKARSS